PRLLYNPPAPETLDAELERQIAGVAPGDLEREMDVLRHFKHSQVLRVAAADVAGALLLRVVSDHLSAIAESVLRATLRLARAHTQRRFGEPYCVEHGVRRRAGFVIVAYGKLGGFELGYGSDLDLVFLHDSRGEPQTSDGAAPIHNQEYFARLAQRIIHLLTTLTPAGKVYDIDTRLRPSGNAGLLVSSLDAYRKYQDEQAWTWEHQALIRARPVAGDADTGAAFSRTRAQVLARVRDADRLKSEVCAMRDRMRRERLGTAGGRFDLKQGRGGITDLEFMVQYLVLRWAAAYPALLPHTDNRHLLGTLAECGILSGEARDELGQAYFDYRARAHALALQEQAAWLGAEEMLGHRARVTAIWQAVLGTTTEEGQ
ncbi:MAG: bifunctional [glutamate--ammonia ligase]-adenylyl-L-tyrosine phosphorylase/[glutamate--ammonia-ligase] adenylyltransferase, partial [Gammaproteobacteria bacterium]